VTLTVNGTEHDSWADVPAELRDELASVGPALPDTDGDGAPARRRWCKRG
jgi:hypothetical protein